MRKIIYITATLLALNLMPVNIASAGGKSNFLTSSILAMPPPTSTPPRGLPPIPRSGEQPRNTNSPPQNLPPTPPQTPNQSQRARAVPTVTSENENIQPEIMYSENTLEQMLQTEVERISRSIGRDLKITLLNTNNPQYKQFVSSGILKMNEQEFSVHDHSLSALLDTGGRFNYNQVPICYILFDPQRGESLWNGFVSPLSEHSHIQTGAAFLVAHEVGHCLDGIERRQRLNRKISWRANEARDIGLWPDAVREVYGEQFNKDAYLQNPREVSQYTSQQQYQERVADAFAAYWIMRLGASEKSIDALKKIRDRFSPDKAHFTSPVYSLVIQNIDYATRQERVDVIWGLARDIQIKSGVSQQAIESNKQKVNPNPKSFKYVVTSQGPVRVDENGNFIENPNTKRPQGQSFENLPRFGN